MGNKPRKPMPIAERAKIFAPFAALKGLYEALAEKEKIREPKRELSQDMAEELNSVLTGISKGQVITAVYYDYVGQQYIQLSGIVTEIDSVYRFLSICAKKIFFDDLYAIFL